uniref:Protein kinase domain-containing protein n=1 Tax=Oryza meridionalis TaxID=40149 RepID=A0A0E0DQC2_9ORYZ
MERMSRVAVAVLLLLCLQLQLGISGGGGGGHGARRGVRPAARLIHAKKSSSSSQQQQQRSRHAGSKAGWPSTSSTPSNPFGLPMLLPPPPPLKDWPPWLDMPPVQGPSSSPSPSPSPAPSPASSAAVAEHAAPPRRGEEHALPRSIALPPASSSGDAGETSRPEVTDGSVTRRGGGGGKTNYVLVAAAGASVLLAASAAAFAACYRSSKVVRSVRPWATGLSGQLQRAFVTGVPALRRAELEAACEDFSNVIGSLPEYTMYKGTLSSGVEIAVVSTTKTSPKDWSKKCEAHFRKKITSLSRVNHKNFVNLLGYCEEEQPFTRMMVFEYAPNGTLFEHLHARDEGHLDWPTRLRVAVGVAYCLEHMHQLAPPEIVRTLDASTVYLTDDFAAKISDVGFCEEEMAAAAAAAPAMADRESVVHGYGMLLLEMMAGRLAASEGGLVQGWAAALLRGERRLRDVMDPALRGAFHAETVDRLDAVVRSCADRDPRRRPSMADVAARLREITAMPPDAAIPKVSPLWWAELEIISTEAA